MYIIEFPKLNDPETIIHFENTLKFIGNYYKNKVFIIITKWDYKAIINNTEEFIQDNILSLLYNNKNKSKIIYVDLPPNGNSTSDIYNLFHTVIRESIYNKNNESIFSYHVNCDSLKKKIKKHYEQEYIINQHNDPIDNNSNIIINVNKPDSITTLRIKTPFNQN